MLSILSFLSGASCQQSEHLYFVDFDNGKAHRADLQSLELETLPISEPIVDAAAIAVDPQSSNIFIANSHPLVSNFTKFILRFNPASHTTQRLDLLPCKGLVINYREEGGGGAMKLYGGNKVLPLQKKRGGGHNKF